MDPVKRFKRLFACMMIMAPILITIAHFRNVHLHNERMDIHGSLLNQTIMYDFSKLPEIFHGIQVPDYLAFVTGRDGIVSTANTCEISYEPRIVAYVYGQYSSRELEQYVSFLEKNGFYIASMIKGEDYYLEKIIDKYKIVVNPYQLVRTGDIGVDITLIDNM